MIYLGPLIKELGLRGMGITYFEVTRKVQGRHDWGEVLRIRE